MGKSKNKNGREVELLRGENRRLKKQLRQYEKQKHLFEAIEEYEPETIELKNVARTCEECGKGEIKLILDLGHKQYFQCEVCDDRKVEKK